MLLKIHALMKYANHKNTFGNSEVKDNMRTIAEPPQSIGQFLRFSTQTHIIRQQQKMLLHGLDVVLRLLQSETEDAILENVLNICGCCLRELISAHRCVTELPLISECRSPNGC